MYISCLIILNTIWCFLITHVIMVQKNDQLPIRGFKYCEPVAFIDQKQCKLHMIRLGYIALVHLVASVDTTQLALYIMFRKLLMLLRLIRWLRRLCTRGLVYPDTQNTKSIWSYWHKSVLPDAVRECNDSCFCFRIIGEYLPKLTGPLPWSSKSYLKAKVSRCEKQPISNKIWTNACMVHKDRKPPKHLSSRRNIAWLKREWVMSWGQSIRLTGQRTVMGMGPKLWRLFCTFNQRTQLSERATFDFVKNWCYGINFASILSKYIK